MLSNIRLRIDSMYMKKHCVLTAQSNTTNNILSRFSVYQFEYYRVSCLDIMCAKV